MDTTPCQTTTFRGLSSFYLRFSTGYDGRRWLPPLLAMLRDSPQLEELFLCLGIGNVSNALPSADPIPTRVPLHALHTFVTLPPPWCTSFLVRSTSFQMRSPCSLQTSLQDSPGRSLPHCHWNHLSEQRPHLRSFTPPATERLSREPTITPSFPVQPPGKAGCQSNNRREPCSSTPPDAGH